MTTTLPPGFVLDRAAGDNRRQSRAELLPGFVLDKNPGDLKVDDAANAGLPTDLPRGFQVDTWPTEPGPQQADRRKLPPLPPGATLDDPQEDPAAALPPLPPGATLDDLQEGFVLDKAAAADNPSLAGGFLRSLGQGATANFGDEIVGLVGGDEAKEGFRRKQQKFEEEHPYLDMTAKGAGAIGSTAGLMLVPGGQVAALGRMGAWGQRLLASMRSAFGATNAAKAIPGANAAVGASVRAIPGVGRAAEILAGTNARRGGLAAMEYGATSRAGDYKGAPNIEGDGRDGADTLMDDAGGRLSAAFDPRAMALDYGLGTGFTKLLNGIMPRVGAAIDDTRTMIAQARGEVGAGAGPIAVAKRLRASNVTPQEMRDVVLPQHRNLHQDAISNIMERYGTLIEGGATDQAARNTIAAELAAQGTNPRTAQTQVREIVQRYQNRNAVPSQVNELAAMAQGADAMPVHRQFEAGINMARDGSEASRVSEFMTNRQPAARGHLSDALEGQLGDGDVGRMLQEHELRRDASNDTYRPFLDTFNGDPEAQGALQRAIDNARLEVEARLGNRSDDMANEVRGQLTKFTNPEQVSVQQLPGPNGERVPNVIEDRGRRGTMDLEAFIHQRRALTNAIENSRKDFRDTPMTQDLRWLKRSMDERVRGIANDDTVPEATRNIFRDWGESNDSRARLEAMQRAFTDGSSLSVNAKGGKSLISMEQTMRRLNRMPNDEQDMFARGLMSQIKAKIETGGDFHDVSKFFTNARMRSVLNRIMGQQQAENFNQLVRRAALATRSARADKNSPTARIRDEKEAEMIFSKLRNAIDVFTSPGRALGAAADMADDVLFRQKNEAVMRILGANTDEPHRLLQTLRDLDQSMRYQHPTVVTPYVRDSGPFFAMPVANELAQSDEETWH